MTNGDDERWETLFSSINEINTTQSSMNNKFKVTNNILDSINSKLEGHENRMKTVESQLDRFDKQRRAKNIVIFRLEDSEAVNGHLIEVICRIFEDLGLEIPNLAIDDAFRLGKGDNCRPVLVKFIATRWVKLVFTKVSHFKDKNLAIANDRSWEERKLRKHKLLETKHLQSMEDKGTHPQPSSSQNSDRSLLRENPQKRKLGSKQASVSTPPKKRRHKIVNNDSDGSHSMTKFLSVIPLNIVGEKLPPGDMESVNKPGDESTT